MSFSARDSSEQIACSSSDDEQLLGLSTCLSVTGGFWPSDNTNVKHNACIVSVNTKRYILACDSIHAIARYMLLPVRLSVRPSITPVDQSKTV